MDEEYWKEGGDSGHDSGFGAHALAGAAFSFVIRFQAVFSVNDCLCTSFVRD
jgi:hypothetical protein